MNGSVAFRQVESDSNVGSWKIVGQSSAGSARAEVYLNDPVAHVRVGEVRLHSLDRVFVRIEE
jgi:hypothetical protein